MHSILILLRVRISRVARYLSRLWTALLSFCAPGRRGISDANEPAPPSPTTQILIDDFPLTDEQKRQRKETFIKSLDIGLVCSLASSHNEGRSCEVVKVDSGSFNVCFVVRFDQDGSQWTVRVPIEHAVADPWGKLLSEVTTISYIARHTQISVPRIRAYGHNARLIKTRSATQMFIISEYIPGKSLDKKAWAAASEEQRRQFLSQLIDILAQLRQHEFLTIGSLMPDLDGRDIPRLGPIRSMCAASLRVPPHAAFGSATRYMQSEFELISALYKPPVRDFTFEDVAEEVFALYHMEQHFTSVIHPKLDTGPFILNHLDLRYTNIIVDQDLRIQGVIDWELAGTIPRQLFTPPSWITGPDTFNADQGIHSKFRHVLNQKSEVDGTCDQLRREWYEEADIGQPSRAFCIAHILRRPTEIVDMFYDHFDQEMAETSKDRLAAFCDANEGLAMEIRERAARSEKYTQYLKDNGLYETWEDRLLAASQVFKEKWGWL